MRGGAIKYCNLAPGRFREKGKHFSFRTFALKMAQAKAIIWPWLSYMCHIRSTAVRAYALLRHERRERMKRIELSISRFGLPTTPKLEGLVTCCLFERETTGNEARCLERTGGCESRARSKFPGTVERWGGGRLVTEEVDARRDRLLHVQVQHLSRACASADSGFRGALRHQHRKTRLG